MIYIYFDELMFAQMIHNLLLYPAFLKLVFDNLVNWRRRPLNKQTQNTILSMANSHQTRINPQHNMTNCITLM